MNGFPIRLSIPQTPRERQEAWEDEFLEPWAARSAGSRGRVIPEDQDTIRTCFHRDRDRIIHSKAFRRLMHKTQVFIDPEEDHYRTRLTHTLEVSQIARTISRALRLNEDLTEAIALAHDLGHPPFGHAGEEALDNAYKEFVPNAGFLHYKQSLRVVEILEYRTDCDPDSEQHIPGLNLTWEVRDGIAHHSKGTADLADAAEVSSTLEGQVVRIADRIAYINHDIDDAIRAGIIAYSDLPVSEMEYFGNSHSMRIAHMVADVVRSSEGKPLVEMSPIMITRMDILKNFMFERVYWSAASENQDFRKAQHVLRALFRLYMEQPEKMNGREVLADLSTEGNAQIVCDFIAGMTDRYAISCFEREFIPHPSQ